MKLSFNPIRKICNHKLLPNQSVKIWTEKVLTVPSDEFCRRQFLEAENFIPINTINIKNQFLIIKELDGTIKESSKMIANKLITRFSTNDNGEIDVQLFKLMKSVINSPKLKNVINKGEIRHLNKFLELIPLKDEKPDMEVISEAKKFFENGKVNEFEDFMSIHKALLNDDGSKFNKHRLNVANILLECEKVHSEEDVFHLMPAIIGIDDSTTKVTLPVARLLLNHPNLTDSMEAKSIISTCMDYSKVKFDSNSLRFAFEALSSNKITDHSKFISTITMLYEKPYLAKFANGILKNDKIKSFDEVYDVLNLSSIHGKSRRAKTTRVLLNKLLNENLIKNGTAFLEIISKLKPEGGFIDVSDLKSVITDLRVKSGVVDIFKSAEIYDYDSIINIMKGPKGTEFKSSGLFKSITKN